MKFSPFRARKTLAGVRQLTTQTVPVCRRGTWDVGRCRDAVASQQFILTTYRRGRVLVVNYRALPRNSTPGRLLPATIYLHFDVGRRMATHGRRADHRGRRQRRWAPAGDADPVSTPWLLLILTSASWKRKLRSGRNYLPPIRLGTMGLISSDLCRRGPHPAASQQYNMSSRTLPPPPLVMQRVKYLLCMLPLSSSNQNIQVNSGSRDRLLCA